MTTEQPAAPEPQSSGAASPSRDQQDALFDVVLYLVNCAPTSLLETPSLAAFRMVDAARRLLEVVAPRDAAEAAFREEGIRQFHDHHNLVMTDQDAFNAWLPEYVRLCTEEAKRRAGL